MATTAGGITAGATSADQSDIRPPRIRIIGPYWSVRRLREQACAVPRLAHACSFFLLLSRDPEIQQWQQHDYQCGECRGDHDQRGKLRMKHMLVEQRANRIG